MAHCLRLSQLDALLSIRQLVVKLVLHVQVRLMTSLQLCFQLAVSVHELVVLIQRDLHFIFTPLESRGQLLNDLISLFELVGFLHLRR